MQDRRSFLKNSVFAASALAVPRTSRQTTSLEIVRPPRLAPGDTIGIVSPAGITWDPDRLAIFEESLAAMSFRTVVGEHAMDRWGYLAGSDEHRASEINAMFADPGVKGVFALAGGWGTARLLPHIDYDLARQNPKVVLGFSDITSILIALYAKSGLVTFHGPTGNSTWNQFTAGYVRRVLMDAEAVSFANPVAAGDTLTVTENRIHTIRGGRARGVLVGGNLTVLTSIVGSEFLPEWEGCILFLEDVDEDIYRVDRMLTQLKLAGILAQLSGVVFGRCSDCDPGSGYGSFTLKEILDHHFGPLGVPAFYGSMIGHIRDKFTIPVGVEAEVDADDGTIQLLAPAVA